MATTLVAPEKETKIWDPLVKLTHWGVAGLVVVNALIVEEGSAWHVWAGYALAALLTLRLLWGVLGPAEARFSSFPPHPGRALKHVAEIHRGEIRHHRSHNPLGAMMVYALWLCLGIIIATGIAMAGPPPASPGMGEESHKAEFAGRQAYDEEEEDEATEGVYGAGGEDHEEGALQEVHEVAVNVLYVLIALHLLGVMFETRRGGRGIVLAMLPGHWNKRQ